MTKGIIIGFALGLSTAQLRNNFSPSTIDYQPRPHGGEPLRRRSVTTMEELKENICDCTANDKTTTTTAIAADSVLPPTENNSPTTEGPSVRTSYKSSPADIERGLILPFEKTPIQEYLPGKKD